MLRRRLLDSETDGKCSSWSFNPSLDGIFPSSRIWASFGFTACTCSGVTRDDPDVDINNYRSLLWFTDTKQQWSLEVCLLRDTKVVVGGMSGESGAATFRFLLTPFRRLILYFLLSYNEQFWKKLVHNQLMIFYKYHTSRTIYQPFDNFDTLVIFVHFIASFIFFQGEPGLHGVKGIRGEPGHKGDRGPLGLPVSTAVHHGIFPATKPCPLFPQTFIEISHFLCLDLLNFLSCISAHIPSVCVACASVCVRACVYTASSIFCPHFHVPGLSSL